MSLTFKFLNCLVAVTSSPRKGIIRGVFLANHLAGTDN